MKRAALMPVLLSIVFFVPSAFAETIVTHETEKYFYENGQMKRYDGQYEQTYLLDREKNTLTRTRIYNYHDKQIIPDETVYEIQNDPDPGLSDNLPVHRPSTVIQAVGQPEARTVELLIVRDGTVTSSVARDGELIVSQADRLK